MHGRRKRFIMDGVIITQLRHIHNPKGNILHVMKKSDKGFGNFGEAYFSTINQNDIKGWKKHTKMTLNLVVPLGEVQFVIYDQYSENFFNIKLSPNNLYAGTPRLLLLASIRAISIALVVCLAAPCKDQ